MGRRRTIPVTTVGQFWNALTADYGDAGSYALLLEGLTAARAANLDDIVGYTDYEYETDLAAGANYVPPAQTMFVFFTETMAAGAVNLEWYDSINTAWTRFIVDETELHQLIQTASQRFRIINSGGSALAIGVYGVTWA